MKKADIIKSKHVDHIENEKNILSKLQHPFVVNSYKRFNYIEKIVRLLWFSLR